MRQNSYGWEQRHGEERLRNISIRLQGVQIESCDVLTLTSGEPQREKSDSATGSLFCDQHCLAHSVSFQGIICKWCNSPCDSQSPRRQASGYALSGYLGQGREGDPLYIWASFCGLGFWTEKKGESEINTSYRGFLLRDHGCTGTSSLMPPSPCPPLRMNCTLKLQIKINASFPKLLFFGIFLHQ